MRFYYFPRRVLITVATVSLLICGAAGLALVWHDHAIMVAGSNSPIYQGNTGKKVVAITVNVDWGEEFIPDMLKEFKKYGAQATFFVTGVWAQKHPELVKQMYQEGHSIQNHGYKHCHFNNLSASSTGTQIKKAEDIISGITGQKTTYFAPPYGEFDKEVARGVGDINYQLVMWSVDTIDWQRPDSSTIVNRVINKIHNDAIILMHPTAPTVKALPNMLQQLQEQGYKMITIDKIWSVPGEKQNHDDK